MEYKETMIVIPVFNEKDNVKPLLESIFHYVPDVSVLMVDDNSPDGTAWEIKKAQGNYPRLFLLERSRKEGLGSAYKAGFKYVMDKFLNTEIIMMMDGDLSHNPKYLPELIKSAESHDLVIGSVYCPGAAIDEDWPWHRKVLSGFANFYCRSILRYPVHDWTNAFCAIRMEALKRVNLNDLVVEDYAFVFGLKYLLLIADATWKEIPTLFKERVSGETKLSSSAIRESMIAPWKMRFMIRKHK